MRKKITQENPLRFLLRFLLRLFYKFSVFAFLMQKQHPQTAYCKYAILIGTIQAEGAFGQLKHNRSFKRFLTGGNIKVLAELLFLGLSQNSLL